MMMVIARSFAGIVNFGDSFDWLPSLGFDSQVSNVAPAAFSRVILIAAGSNDESFSSQSSDRLPSGLEKRGELIGGRDDRLASA